MKAISLFLSFLIVSILPDFVFAQVNRANTKKSVAYRANYQRIALGSYHTLEIREGTLWAWGWNGYGHGDIMGSEQTSARNILYGVYCRR